MPSTTEEQDLTRRQLFKLFRGSQASSTVSWIIICSLTFHLIEPQYILHFLGSIRLPLIVALLASVAWLSVASRSWYGPTPIFGVFLIITGGLVVLGKVWDSFIHNDFLSFHSWMQLALLSSSVVLPLAAVATSGRIFKRVFFFLSLAAAILAVYVIKSGGFGPGGWVFDENDACFALVTLLPFVIVPNSGRRSGLGKFMVAIVSLLCLLGVVATNSRGGFVGLICGGAYLFWRAPQKSRYVLSGVLLMVIAIPFVPANYWEEMLTITRVSEGTALTRRHYWEAAIMLWLQPENILTGVGLGNSPMRLGDMGDVTLYARAVHSLYFQVIPELGLYGIIMVSLIFSKSFLGNLRRLKYLDNYDRERTFKPLANDISLLSRCRDELTFAQSSLLAINTAWIAALSSGAFISVFYYPPIWVLVGLSAGIQRYSDSLISTLAPPERPAARRKSSQEIEEEEAMLLSDNGVF